MLHGCSSYQYAALPLCYHTTLKFFRKVRLTLMLIYSVVYFDQRLGAAPLNASQNQSKTLENTEIYLKHIGIS